MSINQSKFKKIKKQKSNDKSFDHIHIMDVCYSSSFFFVGYFFFRYIFVVWFWKILPTKKKENSTNSCREFSAISNIHVTLFRFLFWMLLLLTISDANWLTLFLFLSLKQWKKLLMSNFFCKFFVFSLKILCDR